MEKTKLYKVKYWIKSVDSAHADLTSWRYYIMTYAAYCTPAHLKFVGFFTHQRCRFIFSCMHSIHIDFIAYKTAWLKDESSWSYVSCPRFFWTPLVFINILTNTNTILWNEQQWCVQNWSMYLIHCNWWLNRNIRILNIT